MNEIFDQLYQSKVVPVVKINNADDAVETAKALYDGGITSAEITFRTSAAANAIQNIHKALPKVLLGAGTVINTEQAKQALDSGAKFIVSPGISRNIIEFGIDHHIPVLPGVCTPTEIMIALEYDLKVVKFFPAKQYGGLATIKALSAVFPNLKFMPTGGINIDNLQEFLVEKYIFACGGSWMVSEHMIDQHQYDEIKRLSKEASDCAKKVRE